MVYAGGLEQEIRWARMGANLIVHSMDIAAFRGALRHDLDAIRAALQEEQGVDQLENINL